MKMRTNRWFAGVGILAVAGSVYLSKSIFSAKAEPVFFGLFLIAIAGFYLAFTAYFGNNDAWRLEGAAAAVFAVVGLVGMRVPSALIAGYVLHGIWDAVHEFAAQSAAGPRQMTSIPLAYGYFCATYDLLMAAYFYTRIEDWRKAR